MINRIKKRLLRLMYGRGFSFFERLGVHVLPIHYYSPVPDTRVLRHTRERWYKEGEFHGVEFDLPGERQLLQQLIQYQPELDALPSIKELASLNLGEGYGEVEARLLYALIRHFKPRSIIEVGSGMSTIYSVKGLSQNKIVDNIAAKITCIEPYARPPLHNLKGDCEIEIVPKVVQDVELEFFESLEPNDILFIDSSHVSKIDSDVNYLYLEVLPRLKPGVLIHIHDIVFPYPTLDPDLWVFKAHQFWSEAQLVQAFLSYNTSFKIRLCTSYLHYKDQDALKCVFKIYDPSVHVPGSLWLQRVA